MKKIRILLSFLISLMILATGCADLDNKLSEENKEIENPNALKAAEINKSTATEIEEVVIKPVEGTPIVTGTTTFVVDIVNRLAEDLVNTELIIPAGEDPHMYEPKPQDLEKLTESDLIIYHGLHFEGRMIDVLEQLGHPLSKDFPVAKVGTMDKEGDIIIDPHFWFDIDLYKQAVENTANYLFQLLPKKADQIKSNRDAYLIALDQMFVECKAKMETIPKESRYLITPHDAFNYFSRSFDIPVMAPQGISTDSEVANKDIQNTVDFIIEKRIKAVFAETTTDPARMEKLQEAAKAEGFEVKVISGEGNELFSDSLAPEGQEGDTFIDMFTHNVNLIVENLK